MLNIMNFVNRYIYLLDDASNTGAVNAAQICEDLEPVLRLVGYVILCIKIVVPVILVVIGMIELAKAVGDDDAVKKATDKLVKKVIVAVLVFLVSTIVGLVMTLIGGDDYTHCTKCLNKPGNCNNDYTLPEAK